MAIRQVFSVSMLFAIVCRSECGRLPRILEHQVSASHGCQSGSKQVICTPEIYQQCANIMSEEQDLPEIKFDTEQLYREESITDRRAGVIRCMVPIKTDGSDDDARPTLYEGHTSIMTQMGSLPVHFSIEAANLNEAVEGFPAAAKQGIIDTLEELKRMQREAQSQIVVPGQGGPGGGMPGGGIQIP